ncbi:MAG TPA: hypothetical protein VF487_06015 [Chitinophagaceae bacterium]
MSTKGSQVVVTKGNSVVATGWLYADTGFGVYIALDKKAKDIRFIARGSYDSISYAYEDVANFPEIFPYEHRDNFHKIDIDKSLENKIEKTFDKIDYNRIYRLNSDFKLLENQFRGNYDNLELQNHSNERGISSPITIALRVRRLYVELLEEIEKSWIEVVLITHSEQIKKLISLGGFPRFDSLLQSSREDRFLLESMIHKTMESNLIVESQLGKTYIKEITEEKIVNVMMSEKSKITEKNKPPSDKPKKIKKIAAIGKIVIGGGLATANAALGIFSGIISALPTLGIGTVSGAIGAVTSIYTGINAACDGLNNFASAMETKG